MQAMIHKSWLRKCDRSPTKRNSNIMVSQNSPFKTVTSFVNNSPNKSPSKSFSPLLRKTRDKFCDENQNYSPLSKFKLVEINEEMEDSLRGMR